MDNHSFFFFVLINVICICRCFTRNLPFTFLHFTTFNQRPRKDIDWMQLVQVKLHKQSKSIFKLLLSDAKMFTLCWHYISLRISLIRILLTPCVVNCKFNMLFCAVLSCGTGLWDCLVCYSIERNECNASCDESQWKMISSLGLSIHVNQLSHIGSFMWTTETQQIAIECFCD